MAHGNGIGAAIVALCMAFGLATTAFAESGSVYLDAGARTTLSDADQGFGRGGGLGLTFGVNDQTEMQLRMGYTFIPALDAGPAARRQFDAAVVSYYAPYEGGFRPMVGAHAGILQTNGLRNLGVDVGMDAMALYDIRDRYQFYASATPAFVFGQGPWDFWLRMGLGIRLRVGN